MNKSKVCNSVQVIETMCNKKSIGSILLCRYAAVLIFRIWIYDVQTPFILFINARIKLRGHREID